MGRTGQRPIKTQDVVWEEGEWWYVGQADGRRRVSAHERKNDTRMFVGGKYVPKHHPLHRQGNYKSWDDVWSHNEIEQVKEGHVYIITNPAFDGWIKVGKAMDAKDRLGNYQTGSPFRDYKIHYSRYFKDRHTAEREVHQLLTRMSFKTSCEWFFMDAEVAQTIIQNLPECK